MENPPVEVATVTPNPAIDWTLTVPGFTAGAVNRVESQHSHPAGKGVNVASTLADHGHRVAVTGFLGRENAAPFEALFARKGIEDRFVRVTGATRVGIKIIDPVSPQTTDVNFPGQVPAPGDVAALHEVVAELAARSGPCCVLAGSLPPGVEPSLYAGVVRALRAAGCRTVLDTSGEPLRHALEAAPHVVKPNLHEMEALVDRTLPTVEEVVAAARALLDRGVELAVVSMGSEGAVFVEAGAAFHARPPNVTVRSTVGAGDAMVAGIVAGRLRRLPLPEVARLATAFSLDCLTRAEGGDASPAWVEVWMREVTIEEIA